MPRTHGRLRLLQQLHSGGAVLGCRLLYLPWDGARGRWLRPPSVVMNSWLACPPAAAAGLTH
eukprot:5424089-Alexandrium_andersonii.AAC.1